MIGSEPKLLSTSEINKNCLFVSLVLLLVSARFNYTNLRYAFLYYSVNKICAVVSHLIVV